MVSGEFASPFGYTLSACYELCVRGATGKTCNDLANNAQSCADLCSGTSLQDNTETYNTALSLCEDATLVVVKEDGSLGFSEPSSSTIPHPAIETPTDSVTGDLGVGTTKPPASSTEGPTASPPTYSPFPVATRPGPNFGAIIGGTLGGVVFLAMGIFICSILRNNQRNGEHAVGAIKGGTQV
ncbi:hypothetical protein ABW20_dc0103088 [Dactylellina cionopaga]|nr:hypothetical protein ABW20_dc0103088 [Dactylellina cionopaga]